ARADRSAEGEDVRFCPALVEGDLDRPLVDGLGLAHELVQAAVVEDAVAMLVDVDSVRVTRRVAVEQDAERDRVARLAREHQMSVACVETEGDAAARPLKRDVLCAGRPLAGEAPLVEPQVLRGGHSLAAGVAEICLGRAQVAPVRLRLYAE